MIMECDQKEKIVYRDQLLHYGIYLPEETPYFWGDVPWHWHNEFEFAYMVGGSMYYKTSHEEFTVNEGDGIFINSGVLHFLHPLEPRERVKLQVQFFDRSFLAGTEGSLLDLKYITPVLENKQFAAVPLLQTDERGRFILESMKAAATLSLQGERFFELRLRNLYSQVWEILYEWALEKGNQKSYQSRDDERIKTMISYIQEHCLEKIDIEAIASSVPVSARECHRLFQTNLGTTPIKFLISCRLQKAAELLIQTEKSILEIAVETGFGTSSYFGKIFRQYHQVTPMQYRRRNHLEHR